MNRFVVGRFASGSAPPRIAPRDGRVILTLPRGRVWAVQHSEEDGPVATGQEDALLLTVGCCLATAGERQVAIAAGRLGDLGPASALSGSHLTVLSTSPDGDVWVFGDGTGVVPLYWVEHDGAVWWASAATPLAALTGAEPDLAWLLGDLTLDGVDFRLSTAPFTGVRRVPPGAALVVYGDRAVPVVRRLPEPEGLSFAEGARRLRQAFTAAVTRRAGAHERVTTDLSGGVDSSAVTCLAVRERPVLAVTYTTAHTEGDDDLAFARRVAAEVGGITHRVVSGDRVRVAHFDGLDEPGTLPVTDVPSLSLGLLSVLAARLAPAVAHGTGAHLTGRGGDNVLGTASSHRVDAFLTGRRLKGVRGAGDFARACRIAPWRAWRQLAATAVTSCPRALERLADRITEPMPDAWRPDPVGALAWCSVTASARWLTPAGRRAIAGLVASRVPEAAAYTRPAALHDRLGLEWMGAEHATFDAIARRQWGVPVHAPFLDTAVASACLAIPSYERVRPGDFKPLARLALTRLVPDWLLARQTKTLFTTSVFDGLAVNAASLRRLIAGSHLAAAGLIDARRAAADLESGIAGAVAPLADLHTLIVTELWLAHRSTTPTRAEWWRPLPVRSLS
jgi:asparagine synthase (glutamine-hydrolysing)